MIFTVFSEGLKNLTFVRFAISGRGQVFNTAGIADVRASFKYVKFETFSEWSLFISHYSAVFFCFFLNGLFFSKGSFLSTNLLETIKIKDVQKYIGKLTGFILILCWYTRSGWIGCAPRVTIGVKFASVIFSNNPISVSHIISEVVVWSTTNS